MDDSRRRFQIRIGINQNIDNLVIDVNGHQNVAGRGINMAQRVMGLADGAQILVGEPVHEILCEREVYLNSFRRFSDKDKHGKPFNAYQFLQEHPGLNTEVPSSFRKATKTTRLTEYAAHFIANAEVYRQVFLDQRDRGSTTFENNSTVLLHLLTLDSMDQIGKGPFEQSVQRVKRSPEGSIYPTYRRIDESESWTVAELASSVALRLAGAADCFEGAVSEIWAFPSDLGKKRAQVEHPEIWEHVMGGSDAK